MGRALSRGASAISEPGGSGLADAMWERTQSLHRRAERAPLIVDLLQGRIGRVRYALYLRNLLPAYAMLEHGLEQKRGAAPIAGIARPELYRSAAIEADLTEMCGVDWPGRLALTPAGEEYAQRVLAAAQGNGARLIAHAYTRFLGDLNGGQMMKRRLMAAQFRPTELTFFDFPRIADPVAFRVDYRAALDAAGVETGDIAGILEEAELAFMLNIRLANAVQDADVP
jgi:heme oxygenase